MDILGMLTLLAPVLSHMADNAGKAQDTNAIIGNNAAQDRPGIVARNLSNSRLASMMAGYTAPKLHWGGPGSAVNGEQASITGGYGDDSPETSELYRQIEKDALNQANNNYGIRDPSASSAGTNALSTASTATSILAAIAKLKGHGASGLPLGGAPAAGPGSPGTFGKGPPLGGGGSSPTTNPDFLPSSDPSAWGQFRPDNPGMVGGHWDATLGQWVGGGGNNDPKMNPDGTFTNPSFTF